MFAQARTAAPAGIAQSAVRRAPAPRFVPVARRAPLQADVIRTRNTNQIMYTLRVLGETDLRDDRGVAVDGLLAQPRPTALLVYMALKNRPGDFYRRDDLTTLFWPETDQEHARTNLRRLVHELRRALGDSTILTQGDGKIGMRPGLVRCDAVEFEAAFHAKQLMRALEIVGSSDPLDWFAVDGAPRLLQWADQRRMQAADMAAAATWSIALQHEGEAHLTEAGRWAQRAFDFAPDAERRLRAVIELMERIGDRAGGLRLYERFRVRLEREHGAIPAAETRALVERMRRG